MSCKHMWYVGTLVPDKHMWCNGTLVLLSIGNKQTYVVHWYTNVQCYHRSPRLFFIGILVRLSIGTRQTYLTYWYTSQAEHWYQASISDTLVRESC